MTEPGTKVEAAEFTDELSDEALDRTEFSACCALSGMIQQEAMP